MESHRSQSHEPAADVVFAVDFFIDDEGRIFEGGDEDGEESEDVDDNEEDEFLRSALGLELRAVKAAAANTAADRLT